MKLNLMKLLLICAITFLTASEEKHIKVIITSFKNAKWYKKNLDSVFSQNYKNYKIIYIDDASPDNTGKLVENYIREKKQQRKTILIKNTQWQSQMANQYRAFHMCDDNDIIVTLDGDDWLHDKDVLSYINRLYDDPELWLTCCGAITWPDGEKCHCTSLSKKKVKKIATKNNFRSMNPFAHLRTFRAWLFKKIKLQDLLYKGSFKALAPTPDSAFMYPMLEMARNHFKRNSKICYVWNRQNPNSQARINLIRQIELGKIIRQWPKYQELKNSDSNISKKFLNHKASVICFLLNNLDNLDGVTGKIKQYITNINAIYFIYDFKKNDQFNQVFSHSGLDIRSIQLNGANFMQELTNAISKTKNDFLVLMTNNTKINKTINANKCIKELEKTAATGFFLSLPFNRDIARKSNFVQLWGEINAWQLEYNKKIWPHPHNLGMILYRKRDIIEKLKSINVNSISQFIKNWASQKNNLKEVGLFFNEQRASIN